MSEKLLTIIIPCYNSEPYIHELFNCLNKQITDEVEVIAVDDGSKKPLHTDYQWVKVIRQENGGASVARNTGLDNAQGEYIAFIDSDDLVADNYISTIISKIKTEHFDYCYLSWKTLPNGWQCNVKLNTIDDKFPSFNMCVWNRIYKRSVIGDIRFNVHKLIAEDAEFIHSINEEDKQKAFISDYMYFYRSDTPNSLTKRFNKGELATRRGVFHYKRITKDMTEVLESVKKYNEIGEAIVMTEQCDIPEMSRYAMVTPPFSVNGTDFFGEPTPLFHRMQIPEKTQVCLWVGHVYSIGGMESFAYYWCSVMKDYYDIIVLCRSIDYEQLKRLRKEVRVISVDDHIRIDCDVLLCSRITDLPPDIVTYKHRYQMMHCCLLPGQNVDIRDENELFLPVSRAVRDSYSKLAGHKVEVVNNIINVKDSKPALRLISCTRLTFEKGGKRIEQLAQMLNNLDIPFIWTIFSNDKLTRDIPGVVYMKPTLNVVSYMPGNDYLVQLSDSEAYCYSVFEALSVGVPCIVTDIPAFEEFGFIDGVHGYKLPLDMKINDAKVMQIYNHRPKVSYKHNNENIIKQWRSILGDSTPTKNYVYIPTNNQIRLKVIKEYVDLQFGKALQPGTIIEVENKRAAELVKAKVAAYYTEP